MWQEFRQFIMRGNVLDLAIAVIMGAAFGAIINSLVNDIIMPPIGLISGRVDFSDLYINLAGTEYASLAAAQEAGAPVIRYGMFINNVISFLIVSLVIFGVVKVANSLQRKKEEAPAPAELSKTEQLLTEIRDLLSERRAE